MWLERREIKSQFLKLFLVMVVVTNNYLHVKGLNNFAVKGLITNIGGERTAPLSSLFGCQWVLYYCVHKQN